MYYYRDSTIESVTVANVGRRCADHACPCFPSVCSALRRFDETGVSGRRDCVESASDWGLYNGHLNEGKRHEAVGPGASGGSRCRIRTSGHVLGARVKRRERSTGGCSRFAQKVAPAQDDLTSLLALVLVQYCIYQHNLIPVPPLRKQENRPAIGHSDGAWCLVFPASIYRDYLPWWCSS